MFHSEPARQVRAIVHIQWLSMKNSLRRRSERLGAIASILATIIWYGFWSAAAAGLFAFSLGVEEDRLARGIPPILFFIFVYWQISPLLTATMGISIDLRKMALYPVSVRTLFFVECLLRLMTGFEMLLLLAGLSVGLGLRHPSAVPLFLPALVFFVAFNALLSAGIRNLLERLLQRRGLREIFFLVVVTASAAPQLILWTGSREKVGRRISSMFRFLPQPILPSTSLAHAYLHQSRPADWILMAAWCAAAAVFGCFQFQRSFRFDAAAARAGAMRLPPGRTTWLDRVYDIPARLLPDPAAALVEKELRYLLRSARFRFLFLMGCSFGVIAWLPFAMRHGNTMGILHANFLTVLSLYGLLMLGQITFLNSFGLDRSAARYFFWMPVSPAMVLAAKNLVGELFVLLQVLVLAVILALLRMKAGPSQLLEAVIITFISSLYLCSAGNFTSVLFGSGLVPERVSRGGAGRGIQGLIVFLYPILISPVLAAYLARYYWKSMHWFLLLLVMAAAGGIALYAATLPLAARIGYLRREKLLQDLARGEGPLVAE
jgi:hypothetical protein